MSITYLIDFSTFVYRFKSVYSWATCEVGGVKINTSALVGSIRSLKSNIYNDIVIVLDGTPSRSIKLLPSYKGTRVKDDTFTGVSVPKLEVAQFLTKIGDLIGKNIKVVCSPGQETDEVISSLVHHITGHLPKRASFLSHLNQRSLHYDPMLTYLQGDYLDLTEYIPQEGRAIISSTDGDFIQLQKFDNVFIDKSTSGKEITNQWTSKSTHDMNPYAAIIYKAVFGDVGDNIPAVLTMDKSLISSIKSIQSEEEVINFYNSILTNTKPNVLTNLYYEVSAHRSQFLVNWDVAFLKFVSYPFALSYPNYRIEDTIAKYNLKV